MINSITCRLFKWDIDRCPFGHILDIRLLDHFLEYFLDFLLDRFFRPFWSFLGPFFYDSLLRRDGWIYLSSVIFVIRYICHPLHLSSVIFVIRAGGGEAGGEGEDALAINAPVTFSGISADHTNYLEHFFHWYFFGWAKFWEGLSSLYFFVLLSCKCETGVKTIARTGMLK